MSGTDLANEGVLRGVAKLLGLPDAAALAEVKPSGLWRLTQRELLDIAKTLGLSKVSRLKKEALLARIWEVLAPQVGADTNVGTIEPHAEAHAEANGESNGTLHASGAELAQPTSAKPRLVAKSSEARPRDGKGAEGKARDTRPGPGASGAEEALVAPPSPQETRESRPGAAHKFDVGEGAEADLQALRAESAAQIPWGYGRDRVTGMPVDPERMYVYWEVTDDAIARARAGLGQGGDAAYLCLRVYDISGRIFDGTNAHSYFDHGLDRSTRQWFFHIGKPTSEAVIEIGLKSHEGYFVKIARSGRVSFPRREPAWGGEPDWMTVRVSTGDIEGHGNGPGPGGPGPGPGPGGPGGGGEHAHGHGGGEGLPYNPMFFQQGGGQLGQVRRFMWGGRFAGDGELYPTEIFRWEEVANVEFDAEVFRSWSWESGAELESWSAGPFAFAVESPQAVQHLFGGSARVFRSGPRTHVVYGPWQVVIKGLGAHAEREVLGKWEIFRSWSGTGLPPGVQLGGEGAGVVQSANVLHVGASEIRLGGASERYRIGASEIRLGGASERMFVGSSELRFAGASERSWKGASELLLAGSSERRIGGASELRSGGASEGRLGAGAGSYGQTSSSGSSSAYPVVSAKPVEKTASK
ncbi:MAG TPA: DUF4912 domain-containing protein [Polyangia bacterium]